MSSGLPTLVPSLPASPMNPEQFTLPTTRVSSGTPNAAPQGDDNIPPPQGVPSGTTGDQTFQTHTPRYLLNSGYVPSMQPWVSGGTPGTSIPSDYFRYGTERRSFSTPSSAQTGFYASVPSNVPPTFP